MIAAPDRTVLVYQPHSYVGRGPPESCIQIISHYHSLGWSTELMLVRARAKLPARIITRAALPVFFKNVPWPIIKNIGVKLLERKLIRRLRQLDPENTVLEVWPGHTARIAAEAQKLGFSIVRVMINCACASSRPILESAFQRHAIQSPPIMSEKTVKDEVEELHGYHFIFSSNDQVDESLRGIGIPESRILQTTFGWDSRRIDKPGFYPKSSGILRFLFVGSVGVRKGVPELLAAWRQVALADAELLIVGNVEPSFTPSFVQLPPNVRHLPYADDIGSIYRSADIFVFPTLEEGGPQVVYEAAACGAAVITTPMGQGRLFQDGINGLIVAPGDAASLSQAMQTLANDSILLARLRKAGQEDARAFEYGEVGRRRAQLLIDVLRARASAIGPRSAPISLGLPHHG